MNGKIEFTSLEQLAEFLKAFTGSTAIFRVCETGSGWVLEFTGGF
jgi:hypothetical protein